jgi:hypothetical protein
MQGIVNRPLSPPWRGFSTPHLNWIISALALGIELYIHPRSSLEGAGKMAVQKK